MNRSGSVAVILPYMDELDAQRVVSQTFPTIDEWRCRVAVAPVIDSRSELERDDADWPYLSLSEIARFGLATATQCLRGVAIHLNADYPLPLAEPTLCRSALVGACIAGWVLGPPSSADRLDRARRVIDDNLRRHTTFMRDFGRAHPGQKAEAEEALGILDERRTQFDALAGSVPNFDITKMIEQTVTEAFGDSTLTAEAGLIWRSGSGTAHALPWSAIHRPGTAQTSKSDNFGVASFTLGGSYADFANGYMAAFRVADWAWQRLDTLRKSP